MVETITKDEEKIVKTVIGKKIICDQCRRVIYDSNIKYSSRPDYYHLATGHNDWGNDSVDSVECYDLCSPVCVNIKIAEYYNRSFNGNNTEYFDLNHINV